MCVRDIKRVTTRCVRGNQRQDARIGFVHMLLKDLVVLDFDFYNFLP